MLFWRKKKNQKEQEEQEREDKIIHHPREPDIEPPVEVEPELSEELKEEIVEPDQAEVLETVEELPVPEHTPVDDAVEAEELSDHTEEGGWLSRLTRGLGKSSKKISQGISDLITKRKLDQDVLDELEELLITADLGPKTAAKLVEELSRNRFGKDVTDDEVKQDLAASMQAILDPVAVPLIPEGAKPYVILVVGVNGVGKTTTIGKLAKQFQSQGKAVMLAAGDTFRAAAVEQLQIWGQRNNCDVVAKDIGADAAALSYEALEKAKQNNADVLMIDTAGRLHNKKDLMAELEKIVRVLKKQDEAVPHSCLLVLDATTGQNAHAQLEVFKDMVDISGLVVTKLDGSAKGGVLVSLADQFGLPVHAIGVGEQIDDLQPFRAEDYAKSLVGLE